MTKRRISEIAILYIKRILYDHKIRKITPKVQREIEKIAKKIDIPAREVTEVVTTLLQEEEGSGRLTISRLRGLGFNVINLTSSS